MEGRLDPESEAYQETSGGSRAIRHYKLRLAYENQMLEAQGGRAATVEMEVGGWLGSYQIHKVNKSTASGRVVSVAVLARTHGRDRWGNEDPKAPEFRLEVVNVERLKPDAYTPPTAEEKAAFLARVKADKKAAKATAPPPIPLINPTLEDARRLQDMINQRHAAEWERHHGKPSASYGPKAREVEVITQAVYSANSGGTYSKAETRGLCADGQLEDPPSNMWSSAREARRKARGPVLCKIRIAGSDPVRVLVLSDKPQKALPAGVWLPVQAPEPQPITV